MTALVLLAAVVALGAFLGALQTDDPIVDAIVVWLIAGAVFLALCLSAASVAAP
nr:MAG TPA: hypothetical protein [Caudoviricetes sp.]